MRRVPNVWLGSARYLDNLARTFPGSPPWTSLDFSPAAPWTTLAPLDLHGSLPDVEQNKHEWVLGLEGVFAREGVLGLGVVLGLA